MGSVNHPRLYDPAAMNLVKDVFREVWGVESKVRTRFSDQRGEWHPKDRHH